MASAQLKQRFQTTRVARKSCHGCVGDASALSEFLFHTARCVVGCCHCEDGVGDFECGRDACGVVDVALDDFDTFALESLGGFFETRRLLFIANYTYTQSQVSSDDSIVIGPDLQPVAVIFLSRP